MARGGYREPNNPAPASGPGRLSRRTDGGPAQKLRVGSGGEYGSRQEMLDLQRSAPLSNTAVEPGDPGAASVDPSQLTPLDAPSAYPNRDITYGLPNGPGPNPDDVFGQQGQMNPKDKSRLALYLPALMTEASMPEASEETRDFVRRLRADL